MCYCIGYGHVANEQLFLLLPCWPVAATSPSLLTVLCSCLIMGSHISYDLLSLRVYFMGLYWQVKLYFAYGLQIIFFLRLPAKCRVVYNHVLANVMVRAWLG